MQRPVRIDQESSSPPRVKFTFVILRSLSQVPARPECTVPCSRTTALFHRNRSPCFRSINEPLIRSQQFRTSNGAIYRRPNSRGSTVANQMEIARRAGNEQGQSAGTVLTYDFLIFVAIHRNLPPTREPTAKCT